MIRKLAGLALLLGVSACSSDERLMDAQVRPSDRAECVVGNDEIDVERSASHRSLRHERCNPDASLKWSNGQSRDKPMEVDFRKKE